MQDTLKLVAWFCYTKLIMLVLPGVTYEKHLSIRLNFMMVTSYQYKFCEIFVESWSNITSLGSRFESKAF